MWERCTVLYVILLLISRLNGHWARSFFKQYHYFRMEEDCLVDLSKYSMFTWYYFSYFVVVLVCKQMSRTSQNKGLWKNSVTLLLFSKLLVFLLIICEAGSKFKNLLKKYFQNFFHFGSWNYTDLQCIIKANYY